MILGSDAEREPSGQIRGRGYFTLRQSWDTFPDPEAAPGAGTIQNFVCGEDSEAEPGPEPKLVSGSEPLTFDSVTNSRVGAGSHPWSRSHPKFWVLAPHPWSRA